MARHALPPLLEPAAARFAAALHRSPLYAPVRDRLTPFAGRRLRIDVAGAVMDLTIGKDGDLHAGCDGEPELHIAVPADRLLRRALGDSTAFEGLAFSGDAVLAQALAGLTRDFYWDWPTALETVLPPPVAAPLGLIAGRLDAALRGAAARARAGAHDYLRNEAGAVTPEEMRVFLDRVDQLREAVDRLQARIDRLEPHA